MWFRDSRSFEQRAVRAKNSVSGRRCAFRKCYIGTRRRIWRFRRRVHESSSARTWIDSVRERAWRRTGLVEKSVRNTSGGKRDHTVLRNRLDSTRLRSTRANAPGTYRIACRTSGTTIAILQRIRETRREVNATTSRDQFTRPSELNLENSFSNSKADRLSITSLK